MPDKHRIGPWVQRMFPDLDALAHRLESRYGGLAAGLETLAAAPVDRTEAERRRVVADGLDGLDRIRRGEADRLTPPQELGLEAIVFLEGRPALLIRKGDFERPPADWSMLENHRDAIRAVIRGVGRIELTRDWLGTGFLVGPRTLMTNRHVAKEFFREKDGGWVFTQPARIDLVKERRSAEKMEFKITGLLGMHDRYDLALLQVENVSSNGQPLPEPLAVAASRPRDLTGPVYVVGYPSPDDGRNEPGAMRRIFHDIYDVKRLQPGYLMSFADNGLSILHDCSTLGGNSGSPVVDLGTHQVVGLHFAGDYREENFAVPLWTLTQDPVLRTGQVNFQ